MTSLISGVALQYESCTQPSSSVHLESTSNARGNVKRDCVLLLWCDAATAGQLIWLALSNAVGVGGAAEAVQSLLSG